MSESEPIFDPEVEDVIADQTYTSTKRSAARERLSTRSPRDITAWLIYAVAAIGIALAACGSDNNEKHSKSGKKVVEYIEDIHKEKLVKAEEEKHWQKARGRILKANDFEKDKALEDKIAADEKAEKDKKAALKEKLVESISRLDELEREIMKINETGYKKKEISSAKQLFARAQNYTRQAAKLKKKSIALAKVAEAEIKSIEKDTDTLMNNPPANKDLHAKRKAQLSKRVTACQQKVVKANALEKKSTKLFAEVNNLIAKMKLILGKPSGPTPNNY